MGGLLLFSLFHHKGRRSPVWDRFKPFALTASGFFIGGLPILSQYDFFIEMYQRQIVSEEALTNKNSFLNLTVLSALAGIYYRADSHFLWGNITDLFTVFLSLTGFVGLVTVLDGRRRFFIAWLLLSTAICVGGLSKYPYPSVTKVQMLMFPYALLVACGGAFIFGVSRKLFTIAFPLFCIGAPILNTAKLYLYNPYQRAVDYTHHLIQKYENAPDNSISVFIFSENEKPWLLKRIAEIYGISQRLLLFSLDNRGRQALQYLVSNSDRDIELWVEKGCEADNDVTSLTVRRGVTFKGPFELREVPRQPSNEWSKITDLVFRTE